MSETSGNMKRETVTSRTHISWNTSLNSCKSNLSFATILANFAINSEVVSAWLRRNFNFNFNFKFSIDNMNSSSVCYKTYQR